MGKIEVGSGALSVLWFLPLPSQASRSSWEPVAAMVENVSRSSVFPQLVVFLGCCKGRTRRCASRRGFRRVVQCPFFASQRLLGVQTRVMAFDVMLRSFGVSNEVFGDIVR